MSEQTKTGRDGSDAGPCSDFCPPWFTGRWRDWHRGHGCGLDDGKPRTPEGQAEIDRAHGKRGGSHAD